MKTQFQLSVLFITIFLSHLFGNVDTRFGKAEWKKYFGEEVPPPKGITQVLKSPCPYSKNGETVGETHILVFIPEGITLNKLGEMIQSPQGGGYATKYGDTSEVTQELGDLPVSESYWVLMTKELILGSLGELYEDQQSLLAEHYSVPRPIEAAIAMLMYHVETGTRLYPHNYTRCYEVLSKKQSHVFIGSFGSLGLYIFNDTGSYGDGFGLAAVRKFY